MTNDKNLDITGHACVKKWTDALEQFGLRHTMTVDLSLQTLPVIITVRLFSNMISYLLFGLPGFQIGKTGAPRRLVKDIIVAG
ncbi:MAG: hypothetical protein CMM74_11415 [Rhodospirillaceae bacterium]|nr:hypothetical protein [Rhodospirillaceae bacterium]